VEMDVFLFHCFIHLGSTHRLWGCEVIHEEEERSKIKMALGDGMRFDAFSVHSVCTG